jgi:hypothetical protein
LCCACSAALCASCATTMASHRATIRRMRQQCVYFIRQRNLKRRREREQARERERERERERGREREKVVRDHSFTTKQEGRTEALGRAPRPLLLPRATGAERDAAGAPADVALHAGAPGRRVRAASAVISSSRLRLASSILARPLSSADRLPAWECRGGATCRVQCDCGTGSPSASGHQHAGSNHSSCSVWQRGWLRGRQTRMRAHSHVHTLSAAATRKPNAASRMDGAPSSVHFAAAGITNGSSFRTPALVSRLTQLASQPRVLSLTCAPGI